MIITVLIFNYSMKETFVQSWIEMGEKEPDFYFFSAWFVKSSCIISELSNNQNVQ